VEPAIAAGPHGRLGLLFYQTASAPTSAHEYVIPTVATSSDAGLTWSVTALGTAFDADAITGGNNDGAPMGPFQDLVALPAGFGATVTMTGPNPAAGNGEDVWWFHINP
jgi:hypothetical protein